MISHLKTIHFLRQIKRRIERERTRFNFRGQISTIQQQVNQYCRERADGQPIFLFAPGLSWNRQLFQRPQQLAQALARQGCLVFYLEPKPQPQRSPFIELGKKLIWANTPTDAFSKIPGLWLYLLTWSLDPSPMLKEPKLWYDMVDDLTTFSGDRVELEQNHQKRMAASHLLTATARNLLTAAAAEKRSAILSSNAVDIDHFSKRPSSPPEDLQPVLANQHPIIAYHGAFARWFDYPMVNEIARANEDLNFLLLGPDIDENLARSGLLHQTNVYWLGEKTYDQLPDYLFFIDAGMIPFILSPITHATSPLKLFEYMALGIPIVASAMQEVLTYPDVFIGNSNEDFSRQIRRALAAKNDPDFQLRLKCSAKENSWQQRAIDILKEIDQVR